MLSAGRQKAPAPYSDAELKALQRVLAPEHWGIVTVFAETRLRLSELENLRWVHVDFPNNALTVRGLKNRRDQTIPLTTAVRRILRKWKRERNQADVVPLEDTVIGARANIWNVLNRAYPAAGIDPERRRWLRPVHSLRDTYITRLVRQLHSL